MFWLSAFVAGLDGIPDTRTMERQYNKTHRDLARNLRKNMTIPEQTLWALLRKRQLDGYRFRHQAPLGRYIVDFVCLDARLVIELDGNPHRHQQAYDRERDNWMQQQQFRLLRFWNDELLNNQEAVLQQIRHALHQQSQHLLPPPPLAGGGLGRGEVRSEVMDFPSVCVDAHAPRGARLWKDVARARMK